MTTEPTAREAIREVLAAYCRGIDRRDRALVTSCFAADATDDHGTGPRPRDEFLAWCFQLLEGYDATFHFLGQSTYDFGSDEECSVETYGMAAHRRAGGPDHRNLVTGFRYLDTMRLTDRWQITRRVAVTDWSRVDHERDWWPVPEQMLRGQSGPDDASYQQ